MSIERLKNFEAGKAFEFEKKVHRIKSVNYYDQKYIIKTNNRTFVFFESEFDVFLEQMNWLAVAVAGTKSHTAEVITVNSRSLRIADKLEEMFNDIAGGDLSDDKLKKATTMVNISNAIVANEVLNLRFMALQNK